MSPDDREKLEQAAATIRQSGILGRSAMLGRLFDLLLQWSLAGEAPKEIEVAEALFSRPGADVVNDASVRVYVHRLRRKLEGYYAGPGRDQPLWLALPKGEYRFVVVSPDAQTGQADNAPRVLSGALKRWRAGVALLLVINLALIALLAWHWRRDAMADVRSSQVWAGMLDNDRPLLIVVGDYYIFGERNELNGIDRLVRQFDVNNPGDLQRLRMMQPELYDRYADVGLAYLPVGAAGAVLKIAPVVDRAIARGRLVRVVPVSQLTATMITSCDIVYVGLLSGLGKLKDVAFAGTRFTIGTSYDELVDKKSGRRYTADVTLGNPAGKPNTNYAFVTGLPSPTGTRILIIAGTRDTALQGAADIVSSVDATDRIGKAAGNGNFEALYRVDGLADENYDRAEIAIAGRSVQALWDASSFHSETFPDSAPER